MASKTISPNELKARILNRKAKKYFYQTSYKKYLSSLVKCPDHGIAVELGAGIGLTKYFISDILLTDIILYSNLDCVIDGKILPFKDNSVRFFCMLNTFHHISNVDVFLSEATRCLTANGRILIIDQHVGLISKWVLKYLHSENYNDKTNSWKFESNNPETDANGALAWIVFKRDCNLLKQKHPELTLIKYKPHTPLFYWLSGGLKFWNLVPAFLIKFVTTLDDYILSLSGDFGSFVDIELVKSDTEL